MKAVFIKDVPHGEYVKRKPDSRKVFKRGDYCRDEKKYELQDTEDHCNFIYLKGSTIVYIGFDY